MSLEIGLVKLEQFLEDAPSWVYERDVAEYHGILDEIEADGITMVAFRIPESRMEFPAIGAQRAAYNGAPGRVIYGDKKQCDQRYFLRQVKGALSYLRNQLIAQAEK